MPLRTLGMARRCVTLALVGCPVLTAPAFAESCPEQPTTQAFLKYGDTSQYALAPRGDFESDTTGWSLTNARVVNGNETGGVLPGTRSLALGGGWISGPSGVITPEFCVNEEHPYFRYMLRPSGPVGLLATFVRYRDVNGSTIQKQVTSNVSTNLFPGSWRPSQLNPLSIKIPLQPGATAKVRLVFLTPLSVLGAGYYIDNVMVDPYRRG